MSTLEKYYDAVGEVTKIVDQAKRDIIKYQDKITDWSNLEILLNGHNGIEDNLDKSSVSQTWYGPNDFTMASFKTEREKVETIEFVLDESDYDFSVTINGKIWFWINSESVITIWDYIEKRINKI